MSNCSESVLVAFAVDCQIYRNIDLTWQSLCTPLTCYHLLISVSLRSVGKYILFALSKFSWFTLSHVWKCGLLNYLVNDFEVIKYFVQFVQCLQHESVAIKHHSTHTVRKKEPNNFNLVGNELSSKSINRAHVNFSHATFFPLDYPDWFSSCKISDDHRMLLQPLHNTV